MIQILKIKIENINVFKVKSIQIQPNIAYFEQVRVVLMLKINNELRRYKKLQFKNGIY